MEPEVHRRRSMEIDRLKAENASLAELLNNLLIALIPVRQLFRSGNSIAVERVTVTKAQWDKVEEVIARRK